MDNLKREYSWMGYVRKNGAMGIRNKVLVIPREAADEVLIKALKKAAGEKTVRKAIEDGMSATDAFAKFGIL